MLLTSMGHWVELAKLEVSEETLLAAARGGGGARGRRRPPTSSSRGWHVGRQEDPEQQLLLQKLAGQMVNVGDAWRAGWRGGVVAFVLDDGAWLLRFGDSGGGPGHVLHQPTGPHRRQLGGAAAYAEGRAWDGSGAAHPRRLAGGTGASSDPHAHGADPLLPAGGRADAACGDGQRGGAVSHPDDALRVPDALGERGREARAAEGRRCARPSRAGTTARRRGGLAESVTKYQQRGGWRHCAAAVLHPRAPGTPCFPAPAPRAWQRRCAAGGGVQLGGWRFRTRRSRPSSCASTSAAGAARGSVCVLDCATHSSKPPPPPPPKPRVSCP
jgi:hypothetical protein